MLVESKYFEDYVMSKKCYYQYSIKLLSFNSITFGNYGKKKMSQLFRKNKKDLKKRAIKGTNSNQKNIPV